MEVTDFTFHVLRSTFCVLRFTFYALLLVCSAIGGVAHADNDKTASLSYTWEPASGPVDHYNVYVSVDGGPFKMIGETLDATPTYTLEGAKAGATYRFKVQAVDDSGNRGPLSDESAPMTVSLPDAAPIVSPDAQRVASPEMEEYKQTREQLLTALTLNPRDANLLYQLAIAEFNLGNTLEARSRLRQAHALIEASGAITQQNKDRSVELHVEGTYNFIPVSKDGWQLQPKGIANQEGLSRRIYQLDRGSVYKMKLESTKPSRSKSLISIPVGLLVLWVFAR